MSPFNQMVGHASFEIFITFERLQYNLKSIQAINSKYDDLHFIWEQFRTKYHLTGILMFQ